MIEPPEHFPIGIDLNGNGPVDPDSPDHCETICWCIDPDCQEWKDADV